MASQNAPNEPASLSVRGWTSSKASTNPDGGVNSLKIFLEKKSSRKINGTEVRGDSLVIFVNSRDVHRFTHLNGYQWAGTTISVEDVSSNPLFNAAPPPYSPRGQPNNNFGSAQQNLQNNVQNNHSNNHSNNQPNNTFRGGRGGRGSNRGGHSNDRRARNTDSMSMDNTPPTVASVENTLVSIIRKRYNAGAKFLTFEALAIDPDIQSVGLTSQPAAKVFAALFVCCEKQVFETQAKRQEMVESLSLSNNSLTTVKDVIAAASTFNSIKNLDLSNNQIADISELRYWRNRFRGLEHLILSGNPVDANPDTKVQMRRWYPKLKMYNNQPLEAANTLSAPVPTGQQFAPQPTQSPVYPLPTEPHPEFPEGSTFGVAVPGKPQDQLVKEQMGLKFSYETRLKMSWVEQCLSANNFNYDAAIADLQRIMDAGNIPADAFLQV